MKQFVTKFMALILMDLTTLYVFPEFYCGKFNRHLSWVAHQSVTKFMARILMDLTTLYVFPEFYCGKFNKHLSWT